MKTYLLLSLLLSITTTGCSTIKKSTLLGAAVGAVLGGTMGNSQGHGRDRDHSTRNGAMIGAALGALIGYGSKTKTSNFNDSNEFKGVIVDLPSSLIGKVPPPPRITKPIVTVKKIERKKVGNNKVRSEGVEWIIKRGCEWVVE